MAAGFVLAGGASRRMGIDKALLLKDGRPLIERVLAEVAAVASPVAISGSPSKYGQFGYPTIPDRTPDCGPLGGLEACLAWSNADRNLFVPCDMLAFPPGLLSRLVAGVAPCVLPVTPDGRWHPLCAVWDRSLHGSIADALRLGRRKVLDVLDKRQVELVPVPWLQNINTPADWATMAEA